MTSDPVAITRDLIRCRSVTPQEGGALGYLQNVLASAGFAAHRTIFAEPGTTPVENLYARIGSEKPNLMFAGLPMLCRRVTRQFGIIRPMPANWQTTRFMAAARST